MSIRRRTWLSYNTLAIWSMLQYCNYTLNIDFMLTTKSKRPPSQIKNTALNLVTWLDMSSANDLWKIRESALRSIFQCFYFPTEGAGAWFCGRSRTKESHNPQFRKLAEKDVQFDQGATFIALYSRIRKSVMPGTSFCAPQYDSCWKEARKNNFRWPQGPRQDLHQPVWQTWLEVEGGYFQGGLVQN